LLSRGCDLTLTDSDGYTAAAHALAFDHISVVQALPIKAFYNKQLNPRITRQPSKVSVNKQIMVNSDDNIDVCVSSNNQSKSSAPIENDVNVKVEFSTGSDMSEDQIEVPWVITRSAFHIICQWGSIKSLTYLLAMKKYFTGMKSTTVLYRLGSVAKGHDSNTKTDIFGTTESNFFPVNYSLDDGSTALHVAARYGHVNCLKKLIEAGGDFRVLDMHGNTPLLLSRKWGNTECDVYLSGLHDSTRKLIIDN
jgi:ankyrin repeat protein